MCVWGVRVVAILDVLFGAMLLAPALFLSDSRNDMAHRAASFTEPMVLGVLTIAVGVVVLVLDRYEWTRPAAVMVVSLELAGATSALAYVSLRWLFG